MPIATIIAIRGSAKDGILGISGLPNDTIHRDPRSSLNGELATNLAMPPSEILYFDALRLRWSKFHGQFSLRAAEIDRRATPERSSITKEEGK